MVVAGVLTAESKLLLELLVAAAGGGGAFSFPIELLLV